MTHSRPLLQAVLALVLALIALGSASAADELLSRAKELMDRREAKAAYELLVPHQSERAGDPNYDYLLGIAALDSGKPGEAVFPLELLNDAGRPCAPGQVGRVVATTLHNFAMPPIRYETGDYAEAGGPCPCGRGLPVLKRVLGRCRNMVRLPDGSSHWPSFPSADWLAVAPIRQIQLVQRTLEEVEVRYALARELSQDECERLAAVFRKCLGHPFRILLTRVERIERNPGMKHEDFVSLVGR